MNSSRLIQSEPFPWFAKLDESVPADLIVAINALNNLGARETTNGQLLGTLCEALGQLGETAAAPEAIKLLDDERPGVRRAAARALGRLRVRAALEQLERLAREDASESVKLSARAAALLIESSQQR